MTLRLLHSARYLLLSQCRPDHPVHCAPQFENVASPDEPIQRSIPVDLRLLFERRLLPALIGQVRVPPSFHLPITSARELCACVTHSTLRTSRTQVKEASGKATKEAAESDRPALIGRILSAKARQELRWGPHSRKSYSGVLTCDNGWKFFGLTGVPSEPASQAKGGQSKIASFFGGVGAASAAGGGTNRGGIGNATHCAGEAGSGAGGAAATSKETSAGAPGRSPNAPRHEPTTPGTDANDVAVALEDEIARWETEVEKLVAARQAISVASGHEEGQPLLLHNYASSLANATRLLDAAKRKRSRLNGGATPPAAWE